SRFPNACIQKISSMAVAASMSSGSMRRSFSLSFEMSAVNLTVTYCSRRAAASGSARRLSIGTSTAAMAGASGSGAVAQAPSASTTNGRHERSDMLVSWIVLMIENRVSPASEHVVSDGGAELLGFGLVVARSRSEPHRLHYRGAVRSDHPAME